MRGFPDRLGAGRPDPLGATWDGLGINFAVFSANAERIDLCLFDRHGRRELARLPLPECTDEVWHGYLPDQQVGLVYGYRAHGPYDPRAGHRFNPHKLLLDPYAKQFIGELRWADSLFGYRLGGSRADLTFDRRDSATAMPKAVVCDDAFTWADDRPPDTPWAKTVIYEAHMGGLSMRRSDLLPPERGTVAGLADPRMLDHLQRLGVTAIELLPVHAFAQDRYLVQKKLRNYWGYSTLGFFTPESRYLEEGSPNSLRHAIRRLHAAGIEVILDVVYNHTCEGSELGPTLSWRGLDNASYYRLIPGRERYYINETGCGNTINIAHPRVLQMVMDSLRYWVSSYHVDGFRFDLGTILGREGTGFDPGSGFFDAIRQDPLLSRVKLISEPWDVGPGGYQLGNHPPGFAEWNDRARDTMRRFWRGDAGQRPELAARIAGSSDLFDRRSRRPWASVNFLTSHDGFTLQDLVSFTQRRNDANLENNQDGHSDNASANWGAEGESVDPAVCALRARVKRAMLATLLLSHGTPMLLAGDEFGRTQRGNNNAYCQDNEISWLDWEMAASSEGVALTEFVAKVLEIRRTYPVLHSAKFMHGRVVPLPGVADIAWFGENGTVLSAQAWNDGHARLLAVRRVGNGEHSGIDATLMLINGSPEAHEFILPPPKFPWKILLDTANPQTTVAVPINNRIVVEDRCVMLLVAQIGEK